MGWAKPQHGAGSMGIEWSVAL